MSISADLCQKIDSVVLSFNEKLSQTSNANSRSISRVSGTNDRIFMSLAKLDHVIWKINTYLSVIRSEEIFKFVDCHHCRLGKWYYEGEGQKNFSHLPSYQKLEAPHSTVHNGTKKVFDLIANEQLDYRALEKALNEMEEGSDGVFELLDRILEEKSR